MPSKIRHRLLISLVVISLITISFTTSYADTANYVYDELNRLIRVEYGDGTIIEYIYDEAGNRTHLYVGEYTLTVNVVGSGTVTKNPDQPIYSSGTNVTLTAVNGSDVFSEWSGDLSGSTNPSVIEMNGNKSVTATFVTPENWLQGWTYRKPVTLSRASGAVTNYQMRLLVGETSGASGEDVDCNGHVLSSFNDLRFTTSDGETLLDYWIESISGTSPNQLATVWIEFDSIDTSATTFYMYYGNAGASAYSDGNATFLLFDHFEGSSLDTDKWQITGNGTAAISVSSSEVTLNSNGNGEADVFSKSSISENGIRIRTRNKLIVAASYYAHVLVWKASNNSWTVTPPAQYRWASYHTTPLWYYMREFTGTSWVDHSTGATPDRDANYHIIEIRDDGSNKSFFYDATQYGSAISDSSRTSGYISISVWGYSGYSPDHIVDWITVGKFVATEPTWGSWGAEESN